MTKSSTARRQRRRRTIKLQDSDLREFAMLERKEQVVRKAAQDALLSIARQGETFLRRMSKREGVDLAQYDIDWQTGIATLPEKAEDDVVQDGG